MRYVAWFALGVCALGCGQAPVTGRDAVTPDAVLERVDSSIPSTVIGQVKSDDPSSGPDRHVRKIVHTATLHVAVEEFDPVPGAVAAVADRFGAYVARSDVDNASRAARRGTWTIRVPVDRYDACLEALRQLGEIDNESADSKDVTEEFYDLDVRIRNKKRQEDRLVRLLDEATGKLDEILSVERELARVRGEVEQMEGRLRVLADLTALATIHLNVREIPIHKTPDVPGYATRARRTFQTSLHCLIDACQGLSLLVVMVLPWVGVLAALGLGIWGAGRIVRLLRR
ncbi:MAG: DUF4349 domain-containing protein [Pirellulales bacterium]|nr:DUF4349 domain-containing protein [Pirellulales bacterium]